jgi:hypothetical protein
MTKKLIFSALGAFIIGGIFGGFLGSLKTAQTTDVGTTYSTQKDYTSSPEDETTPPSSTYQKR